MRNLIPVLVVLILGLVGGYFVHDYFHNKSRITQSESADVLLEQVRKVLKVVTVEGEFSEIYSYDNTWHLLFYPAQKKALVRVKANVMVGYDMEKVTIDVDESSRTVLVRDIPAPKILSLEKSLDYYDLTESRFNQFNEKDLNLIEKSTERKIREKVNQSDLYIKAQEQLNSYIETLQFILAEYGWELQRDDAFPRQEAPGITEDK